MKLIFVNRAIQKMYEVPLRSWIEKGNSKTNLFFKLWLDLYEISNKYKRTKVNMSLK
jgi:hypothetical protein